MHVSLARSIGIGVLMIAAGALNACGNVSHKVASDGSGAGELVWPAPDSVTPMHKGGTFPNVADLRLIKSGTNKQQIMQLIGPPHFSEGVWEVREWNYLFNFHKRDSDQVIQCEYKVLFDEQKLARSFYWKPESCADQLNVRAPKAAPAASKASAAAVQTLTLSADALFAFDKSSLADVKPGGRAALDDLATNLKAGDVDAEHVRVIGYTDRLGSDAYNQALSTRRAETIRNYLVSKGLAKDIVSAEGRGEAEPVAIDCHQQSRAELIACLAPNRRVVVEVAAHK